MRADARIAHIAGRTRAAAAADQGNCTSKPSKNRFWKGRQADRKGRLGGAAARAAGTACAQPHSLSFLTCGMVICHNEMRTAADTEARTSWPRHVLMPLCRCFRGVAIPSHKRR